jgi:hypothetical protein
MTQPIYDLEYLAGLPEHKVEQMYDYVSSEILTFIKAGKPRNHTKARHLGQLAELRQQANELLEELMGREESREDN